MPKTLDERCYWSSLPYRQMIVYLQSLRSSLGRSDASVHVVGHSDVWGKQVVMERRGGRGKITVRLYPGQYNKSEPTQTEVADTVEEAIEAAVRWVTSEQPETS
jgi:hypothetical protein